MLIVDSQIHLWPSSYGQCVTMFTEELPWLRGRGLERVMGEAISDWLGWKRPAEA
jgi:hypothetical protein